MECPNCHEKLSITTTLPSEQIMYYRIKYEGELLSARTVHGTLAALEKALLLLAKDEGVKARVFVHSVEQKPHELTIGLLLTADPIKVKGGKTARGGHATPPGE